jgi:hypothetical protein
VRVGRRDGHVDELAHRQLAVRLERRLDVHDAVDFRRIGAGAAPPPVRVTSSISTRTVLPTLACRRFRDFFLQQHHAAAALFAHFFRHGIGDSLAVAPSTGE